MTGQSLVEAVAGDARTDRHLDSCIDVRATSQPFFFFLGRKAVQTHLRAERRKRLANA